MKLEGFDPEAAARERERSARPGDGSARGWAPIVKHDRRPAPAPSPPPPDDPAAAPPPPAADAGADAGAADAVAAGDAADADVPPAAECGEWAEMLTQLDGLGQQLVLALEYLDAHPPPEMTFSRDFPEDAKPARGVQVMLMSHRGTFKLGDARVVAPPSEGKKPVSMMKVVKRGGMMGALLGGSVLVPTGNSPTPEAGVRLYGATEANPYNQRVDEMHDDAMFWRDPDEVRGRGGSGEGRGGTPGASRGAP